MALDPGRQWLAAGITGLARRREWDAVVTVEAPGAPGDEIEVVVLPARPPLVVRSSTDADARPLVTALSGVLAAPFRALGVRRPELWVVGGIALETVELDGVRGQEIEVVRDGAGVRVRIDALPTAERIGALERAGERRGDAYVARARRLVADTFELEVEPL